ncbi:MAG: hypothetical protein HC778_02610 [Chamaesiphon sp. CSU_1_12]|nr:hypothetical protein [Chamaesiphon sp. CSU_1_12]
MHQQIAISFSIDRVSSWADGGGQMLLCLLYNSSTMFAHPTSLAVRTSS